VTAAIRARGNLYQLREGLPYGGLERLTKGCPSVNRSQTFILPANTVKKPLFSIITSTFNAGNTIDIAASSVRDQHRDDVEYIVVDGASKDDTLKHIERNRDVITHVVSEPDTGIYDALNKGIMLARGELICVIGSDDSLIPGALSAVAERYAKDRADILAGETLLTDGNGRGALREDEEYGIGALVSGIPFGHNAMFASKKAYEKVGIYDTSYRITADANWVHRAIRAGMSCSMVDRVLVQFASTGVSSNNGDRVLEESGRTIRENFPVLSQQEALDLLFGVRGWAGPQAMAEILIRHLDEDLHASVFAALKPKPAAIDFIKGRLSEAVGALASVNTHTAPARTLPPTAPVVSFIIPAYNVAGYIGRCLDSLTVEQNFKDIEVIVVDDGSHDETASIVQSYMAHDSRIRLIQQPNQGQGAARSVAMPHANGKYVWFIDSDDRIQPGALDRLVSIFEQDADIDALVLNFAYEEEDGHLEYSPLVPSWLGGKAVDPLVNEQTFSALGSWNCPPWRYFLRREFLIQKSISFEAGFFYEDHPFAIDIVTQARKIYVDTPVSYYYLRRAGSTVRSLDGRCFDFLPIRRMVLDRLAKRGLLDRFPVTTCSYAMPIDFARALVPGPMMPEFITAVWQDITQHEIEILRDHGSLDELALVEAGVRGQIATADLASMISSYSFVGRHLEISRTLMSCDIKGLDIVEGPYPEYGLHERFQWVSGRRLRVIARRSDMKDQHLVLRLRSHLPGQVLMVQQNGKTIEIVPCRSTRIEDHHDLVIKLIDEPQVRVDIEFAQSDGEGRDLSVILERAEIIGRKELEEPAFDLIAWAKPERIVTGPRTRLEHIAVDVRVDPQPRPYVLIGMESQVSGTFVFERGLGQITIGDRSSIGGGSLLVCTQDAGIHIGSNVMLSWDVTVIDSNSHSIDPKIRLNDAFDWLAGVEVGRMGHFKDWSCVKSAPVHIHDGAWIGFGSSIMKGVTIGKGAVVASNSVVTKDVPAGAIVAGNPARVVSYVDGFKPTTSVRNEELLSAPEQATLQLREEVITGLGIQ
jgi:glycosyltransferase involved in cell wall biosynthesis/acetyltransferase-like isoleucine patch superfamily enzyme